MKLNDELSDDEIKLLQKSIEENKHNEGLPLHFEYNEGPNQRVTKFPGRLMRGGNTIILLGSHHIEIILKALNGETAEHAASLAAFAQRAADVVVEACEARGNNFEGPYYINRQSAIENIEALLPTADLEYHLALVEAKIEEAKWWHGYAIEENPHKCGLLSECVRLEKLTAEATRIKAAIEDARRKV